MANIQNLLNKILLARYGKDVRQSIHDAINEMNIQIENSETSAGNSAMAASKSEENALQSAQNAADKSNIADEKATLAGQYAIMAESFTHGGTSTRDNEAVDNAQYYLEQAKQLSQAGNGLIPIGTISFAELSLEVNQEAKYMFNISDEFTTDDSFKEGSGHTYPAGTNVYRTNDGYWDCLAGSFQTPNGDVRDNTVTFVSDDSESSSSWTEVTLLKTGEKLSVLFGKLSTVVKNVRWIYKKISELNSKVDDSGWQFVSELGLYTENFTDYSSNQAMRFRKIGNMVNICGSVKAVNDIAIGGTNNSSLIFTLPEGYLPDVILNNVCQGSYMNRWDCTINPETGEVKISRYGSTSETLDVPTNAYLPINITYFTA